MRDQSPSKATVGLKCHVQSETTGTIRRLVRERRLARERRPVRGRTLVRERAGMVLQARGISFGPSMAPRDSSHVPLGIRLGVLLRLDWSMDIRRISKFMLLRLLLEEDGQNVMGRDLTSSCAMGNFDVPA